MVAGAFLLLIATALLIVFFFLGSVYGSRTTAVGGMLIAAAGTAPMTRLSHDGSVYAGLLPGSLSPHSASATTTALAMVAHEEAGLALGRRQHLPRGGGFDRRGRPVHRRRHAASRPTAVVVVGVLGVAVRLGLGAVLFAHWRWIGWVAGLVLAVVLVKITALTGPARFALRLGSASEGG
ncbi:hypothetical protein ACFWD7_39125 [Streptomyces mirabilis]|uniref:hypothetical protein n=1 Tax=Streptomyces mirabilis TaxID=68239 RepID=UPI0028F73229|nr:hypothetical protein [Streptomyces mirabilis]